MKMQAGTSALESRARWHRARLFLLLADEQVAQSGVPHSRQTSQSARGIALSLSQTRLTPVQSFLLLLRRRASALAPRAVRNEK